MRLSEEVCLRARALVASRPRLGFWEHRQADLERGDLLVVRNTAAASA